MRTEKTPCAHTHAHTHTHAMPASPLSVPRGAIEKGKTRFVRVQTHTHTHTRFRSKKRSTGGLEVRTHKTSCAYTHTHTRTRTRCPHLHTHRLADDHEGVDLHVGEVEVNVELVQGVHKVAHNALAMARHLLGQVVHLCECMRAVGKRV